VIVTRVSPDNNLRAPHAAVHNNTVSGTFQLKPILITNASAAIPSTAQVSGTLHSLFRVLCNFPSRYLLAIGISGIFRVGRHLPPVFRHYSQSVLLDRTIHRCKVSDDTGLSPSMAHPSKWLHPSLTRETAPTLQLHELKSPRIQDALLPFHSQLLRESRLISFPLPIDMLKFSG